jgi:hypothetical protein
MKFFLWMALFILVGCSSYFTRKGCEKVNWFQHAHDVAMDGKRLEEDSRIRECEKAETEINSAELDRGFKSGMENYCKLETAYSKGAGGDGFNFEFCDYNMMTKLKNRYGDGIKKFCTPENGYLIGTQGLLYKNQCSKETEPAFMAKYKKGRQIYLKNKMASNTSQVQALDTEIREQQSLRQNALTRQALLPRTQVVTKNKQFDPATNSYKEQTVVTEDPNIQRQRQDLEWELRSINQRIQEKINQQTQLRAESDKLRNELDGLN